MYGPTSWRRPTCFLVGFIIITLVTGYGPTQTYADAAAAPGSPDKADQLTVERIFGDATLFNSLPAGIRWTGDGKAISYISGVDDGRAFVVRPVPSGRSRIICVADTVSVPDDLVEEGSHFGISPMYKWSQDAKHVVFSFREELFTIEAKSGRVTRRTHAAGNERDPVFSPDSKKLAYTRDHDIYVLDLASNEEIRVTETGSDSVYNGILDWVYMEELFTRGNVRAFWWSPDSKQLAFLEIREDPVPEFPLVDWIPVHATYNLQHYPKSGDPNPVVRVGIVSADGGAITWADTDTSDDSYIARVYWLGDSRNVAIEKLNRTQDRLTLYFASDRSGKLEEVLEETASTWVNVNYLKHYYENKRMFVWGSERDGHSHLYLYNIDGSLARQVTKGEWEVTELNGVDEKKGKIYFTANEGDVLDRHLFEVTEKGKMNRITKEPGTHSISIAPNYKYYIDRFHSHERPTRVTVYSMNGRKVFEVGDQFSEELRDVTRAVPEFLTIEKDGRTYHCAITKPLDFDASRRYPVIVYTYGGPHSQTVRRAWSRHNLWHSMMAEKGYIVFSLDNRGSYGRGKAWEEPVLKDLGNYELQDQIIGVDYLKSLPYVDGGRIGIWGWSYGGYMTLMALFKAADVFKAGVAVAPVTDWHLYDSIYTERYMKGPEDNPEGYEVSAPLNYVDGLKGRLLLMHGDADDNVHVQNSIKLVRKLIDSGKDFDLMLYPQKYHGISGAANRMHLYRKMTDFFDRNLKGADPRLP